MNIPINPHKWSIPIFCINIHPHRPWYVLFIPIQPAKSMTIRSNHHANNYRNGFPWIRPTLRTNIILRSYSHYRSSVSNPTGRERPSSLNLRGTIRISTNPKPILFSSLPPTNSINSTGNDTFNTSTRKRVF